MGLLALVGGLVVKEGGRVLRIQKKWQVNMTCHKCIRCSLKKAK